MLVVKFYTAKIKLCICFYVSRWDILKVGPSEGLKIRGCQYYLVGIICPLVEIGLTVLPKSGGAMAPPGTTSLKYSAAVQQIDWQGKMTSPELWMHRNARCLAKLKVVYKSQRFSLQSLKNGARWHNRARDTAGFSNPGGLAVMWWA